MQVRPVDILRQLLLEQRGPDTEAVRAYFQTQSLEQACATCLILATLESSQNAQVNIFVYIFTNFMYIYIFCMCFFLIKLLVKFSIVSLLLIINIFDNLQLSEWATRAFFLYGGQRITGIGPTIDTHSSFPSINPGKYTMFYIRYKCISYWISTENKI